MINIPLPMRFPLYFVGYCLLSANFVVQAANTAEQLEIIAEIVQPDKISPLEDRAATELKRYLEKISGKKCVLGNAASQKIAGIVFIVSEVTKADSLGLSKDRLARISGRVPDHQEGYIIWSSKNKAGRRETYLLGRTPLACLYAVYDYLGSVCGVGYFQDGEYVPRLSVLPDKDLKLIRQPRFDDRLHFAWTSHRTLKKYHAFWWSEEEWEKEFDWMAKRRLNMFRLAMNYYSRFAGDAYEQAFPKIGPEQEEVLYPRLSGWPEGWGWPPEYRRKLTQKLLNYGRRRGVRFIYSIDYATVPLRFKRYYPEYQYLGPDQYGESRRVSPEDPRSLEVGRMAMQKIVEIFGTDHLYHSAPYCELDVAGGSKEKNLQLRILAAKQLVDFIKQIDPKGLWVTDTWDMVARHSWWDAATVKRYFDPFKFEDVYIYETSADLVSPPHYKQYESWYGKRWAFGILHAFAGDDALHGNPAQVIHRVQEAAGLENCTGLFMVPECTHHNIMFWDLVSELAWEPSGIDLDDYLSDFCRRRYGRESSEKMRGAWQKIVKAVYWYPQPEKSGNDNRHYPVSHWDPQWPYYARQFQLVAEREDDLKSNVSICQRQVRLLQEALSGMLAERDRQRENRLYLEDIVVVFRSFAGKLFNTQAAQVYFAFKRGDKQTFVHHRDRAMTCMASLQDVLSACPSYSLNETIAAACSVPGYNKYLPEMIRQGCLNHDYTHNDVYEQFGGFYIPRMLSYFQHLHSQLDKTERMVTLAEVQALSDPIADNFRKNGWVGPDLKPRDALELASQHFAMLSTFLSEK